jgi:hypothetical protein
MTWGLGGDMMAINTAHMTARREVLFCKDYLVLQKDMKELDNLVLVPQS